MTKTIIVAAALALAVTLPAAPAQAQAGRTFVSAAGNDSNPCTITLPCRNLQAAYNAVAANGQIDALDPGNYGSLTITGPVSIQGHGWAAMSTTTGAAITINASGATDKISISGVVLDGLGIVGTNGIQFNSGGSLNVRDSVIRNFSDNGINFYPTGLSNLFVSDTLVSDNGFNGISLGGGPGTMTGVLDHVRLENNANDGLILGAPTQTVNITFSNSVSANNGAAGIIAITSGGTPASVMAQNSTIANNSTGLVANGSTATVRVTRSAITGNATAWAVMSSGAVASYGDNNIDGNGSANTAPPFIGYK
jgi:hypothetical protein